ncbi:MAG: hypothetical protein ABJZ55_00680 [Fuerstiella sp.]
MRWKSMQPVLLYGMLLVAFHASSAADDKSPLVVHSNDALTNLIQQQSRSLNSSKDFQLSVSRTQHKSERGNTKHVTLGWLVRTDGHRHQLLVSKNQSATLLGTDERLFRIGKTPNDIAQVIDFDEWFFRLNQENRSAFSLPKNVAKGSPKVSIDLAGCLGPLVFGNEETFEWHAVTNSWIGAYPKASIKLNIRRHSPSDQLATGAAIADVVIVQRSESPSPTQHQHIRCILGGTSRISRLNLPDDGVIERTVELGDPASSKQPSGLTAKEHWRTLKVFDLLTPENNVDPIAEQLLPFLSNYIFFAQNNGVAQSEEHLIETLKEVTPVLRKFRQQLVKSQLKSDGTLIDDPAMNWHLLRRDFAAGPLNVIYDFLPIMIWKMNSPSKEEFETITDFLDAIGDCGAPEFPGALVFLQQPDTFSSDYFQAFLRSRWKMPCSHQQIQACLDGQFSDGRLTVFDTTRVETLLRLDQADHVDESVFQKWWNAEVVHANDAARAEHLAVVSSQPSGRKRLISRVRMRADSSNTDIEKLVARQLKQRIAAARRLQRWDAMTSQECTETEFVLEAAGL